VSGLGHDLRLALRGLRKRPTFSLVVVTVLALGIGANTAIFSVVDALVLRPLPFPRPAELVTIHTRSLSSDRLALISWPDFADVRAQSRTLGPMAVYRQRGLVLSGLGEPETIPGVVASAALFDVLGVAPARGRAFLPGDDEPGRPGVVVVSHGFWQRRLGGDPAVLGRNIVLDDERFTIVGVAPAAFRFPLDDRAPEVWMPLHGSLDQQGRRWRSMLPYRSAIARRRAPADLAAAQGELDVIHARLAQLYPKDDGSRLFVARSFSDEWIAGGRLALLVLWGAAALVLLVACANVAGLLLARAASRRHELAVRSALGAGRGRLVRQLLVESLLLVALGAALGMLAGRLGLEVLLAAIPAEWGRPHEIALDGRVLAYAVALSMLVGALVGSVPAWLATRASPRSALAGTGRAVTGTRLHGGLMVLEIALALVLVAGTGLLVRSFARVSGVDPGFESRGLLMARLKTSGRDRDQAALYRALRAGLEELPGATGTAIAAPLPFAGWFGGSMHFTLDDRPPPPPDVAWWFSWQMASPRYFQTLGVPLLRGRGFEAGDDHPDAPQVAIVNQAFARRYWPDGDPLGRHVLAYNRYRWRIVGVVGDTRGSTCPPAGCAGHDAGWLEQPAEPALYTPLGRDCCPPDLHVLVRHPDPLSVVPALRALVSRIDPGLPVEELRTMDQAIGGSLAQRRLNTALLGLFAALALLLAAVGLYGLLSYAVAQRTREVAIRMALGAQAAQVLRLVVGQGMRLALAGLALGVAGALACTRVLASQLYQVSPTDPLTFAVAVAALASLALLASYLPARRATRVDPNVALREE
jgi:putative ABC transport system permease protein